MAAESLTQIIALFPVATNWAINLAKPFTQRARTDTPGAKKWGSDQSRGRGAGILLVFYRRLNWAGTILAPVGK